MKRVVLLICILCLAIPKSTSASRKIFLPIIRNDFIYTTSLYMKGESVVNTNKMVNLGINYGLYDPSGAIALFFGDPHAEGSNSSLIGTFAPFDQEFLSIDEIINGMKNFIRGLSISINYPTTIIVATNNNFDGTIRGSHGLWWRWMIGQLDAYAQSKSDLIRIAGGSNIELNYGTPESTKSWLSGYADNNTIKFYSLGSCEGCPSNNHPDWEPNNNWTLDDIWFVSQGHPLANAIPEIYTEDGSNASQWQYLSHWASFNRSGRIYFKGILTTYGGCIDQQDTDDCAGIKNTPEQAYQQLFNVLNADIFTKIPSIPYATDVRWAYRR